LVPGSSLQLKINNTEIDSFISKVSYPDGYPKLAFQSKSLPIHLFTSGGDKSCRTTERTLFHLFNFPSFTGKDFEIHKSQNLLVQLNFIDLTYNKWRTKIQELDTSREAFKAIRETGGTYLTHVAETTKLNNEAYSHEELQEHFSLLSTFLSFVRGVTFWPTCSIGFGEDNSEVWKEWNYPSQSTKPPCSWFSSHHPEQLEQLFPLFSELWDTSSSWQDTLRTAIYWYVQASQGGVGLGMDTSII